MTDRNGLKGVGRRAARRVEALKGDSRGNVALIFGLLMVPVAMLTFASLDLYRVTSARSNLQDALDAAALVAARTQTVDPVRINAAGQSALTAGLQLGDGVRLVSSDFALVAGRIVANAETEIDPIISDLFMPDGLTTSAHSEIVRGATRLEIAMVLDVTGSMLESRGGVSKLQRLRTAGVELVNIMQQTATQSGDPSSVRMSVVPFGQTVRVGSQYRSGNNVNSDTVAPWLVDSTTHAVSNQLFSHAGSGAPARTVNRFALFDQVGRAWAGCVEQRPIPFDVTDAAPSPSQPNSYFIPYFAPDEPDQENSYYVSGSTRYDLPTYNNYIDDKEPSSGWPTTNGFGQSRFWRAQGDVAKYSSPRWTDTNAGPNEGCELSPMLRLTNDFNAIRTRINGLQAAGNTNIPLGLSWGWHSLSPNAPFSDGASYSDRDVTKVAILMTDGNNTNAISYNWNEALYSGVSYIKQNRLGITAGNDAQRTAAMDARLALLCQNMRNQGVIIYTVRVEVTDGSSDVLRNCATSEENFYNVEDASQLSDAFRSIAGSITRLRIAQ